MDEAIIKHNFELFDWAKKNANGDDIIVYFANGSASMTIDPTQVPATPTIDEDRADYLLASYYDDEAGHSVYVWESEKDPGNLEKFQAVLYYGEIFAIGVWIPLVGDDRKDLEYFEEIDEALGKFSFKTPEDDAAYDRFYETVDWSRYDRGQNIHYRLNDYGDKYLEKRD